MYVVRTRGSAVSILVAIVMLLVPALAWMQYQWLGQLSEAERERMQRTLRTAAAQFANEFDTELSRTLISLQVDGASLRDQNWAAYAQRYSRGRPARRAAPRPRCLARRHAARHDAAVARWQRAGPGRSPAHPPLECAGDDVRRRGVARRSCRSSALRSRRASSDSRCSAAGGRCQRTHRDAAVSVTLGDDTTLISPVTLFEFPDDHRGPPKISILGFTIVRLDPAVIRDTMLTTLTARHFTATTARPTIASRSCTATIRRRWSGNRSLASQEP